MKLKHLAVATVAVGVLVILYLPMVRPRQKRSKQYLGKGVWIWMISDAENGNINRIVSRAEQVGLDHVLVKTHDGSKQRNDPKKLVALIEALHKKGIIVLAWGYVYGRKPKAEAELAKEALALAFDGYVFDMEQEFTGKPEVADRLAAEVKKFRDSRFPDKILAYSSFSKVFHQPNVPYLEFGRHTDLAMPQDYWAVFGTKPAETLARMCQRWAAMEAGWKKAGFDDSVKPIIPTGQIVDNRGRRVHAKELGEFLHAGRRYFGINIWRWDLMSKSHWEVLQAFEPEKRPLQSLPAARRTLRLPWYVKVYLSGVSLLAILAVLVFVRQNLPNQVLLTVVTWPYYLIVLIVAIVVAIIRARKRAPGLLT